ncbi:CPBP family intramembrane metalloprotease [Algoriphagus lacus]|uniref:CPBP family intramembrane metalloprotease n=1 Tax=Algoriphagus lacus TaxID=2056311 RepID=A0A418PNF9_9BACT|nr:CPBP family intramembrane glutamic endopeptidase [Algoriphagus lacus]RIW13367.1 CPBP family intramembrane metalloprotease [Algoriphagus lacus]
MKISLSAQRISYPNILSVLLGFPLIATLISLLLLKRTLITDLGFDFFNAFWLIITGWYAIQIFLISRVLRSSGWTWSDIGYTLSKKQTIYLVLGYLVFAFSLMGFIELALANSAVDIEKLNSIISLSPKTTTARVIFIFMGLFAGIAEELVYRGYAIQSLISQKLNKWLAVLLASIPFIFQHGLKSLDQFWWFFVWGLVFGVLFLWLKSLTVNIIIHWLVILSAMVAILSVLQ